LNTGSARSAPTFLAAQSTRRTRVLGEVDRIARRGRNFGFRLISITQRPAKLNKDVLTQLSTLVAPGVTGPQDRDAVKASVEGNADREQAPGSPPDLMSLEKSRQRFEQLHYRRAPLARRCWFRKVFTSPVPSAPRPR
jgi:hypothetical protein